MSETVDEKAEEDGLAVESVIAGIACDRLVMIGCGENNAVCLLYDITDGLDSPQLIKTFSTSPVSETLNPQQAYDARTLGDLDSETMLMVADEQSPTGKAGIIFGGAICGTLSFYEFVCPSLNGESESNSGGGSTVGNSTDGSSGNGGSGSTGGSSSTVGSESEATGGGDSDDSNSGLSGGAIAGIAIGAVAVIGLLAFVAMKGDKNGQKEMDTGASGGTEQPTGDVA